MEFDTDEAAKEYYIAYANRVGFGVCMKSPAAPGSPPPWIQLFLSQKEAKKLSITLPLSFPYRVRWIIRRLSFRTMPALIISSKICGILEVSNVTGGALSFFLLPDDVKIAYDGEAIL